MSDPKTPEPDEELLEFLGGIDEVNDESQDEDFSDFLANDRHREARGAARKPKAAREGRHKVSDSRTCYAPGRAGRVVRGGTAIAPSAARAPMNARPPPHRRARAGAWSTRSSAEEQKILDRYGERWNSLPAEQQQRLLRGTRRWLDDDA